MTTAPPATTTPSSRPVPGSTTTGTLGDPDADAGDYVEEPEAAVEDEDEDGAGLHRRVTRRLRT